MVNIDLIRVDIFLNSGEKIGHNILDRVISDIDNCTIIAQTIYLKHPINNDIITINNKSFNKDKIKKVKKELIKYHKLGYKTTSEIEDGPCFDDAMNQYCKMSIMPDIFEKPKKLNKKDIIKNIDIVKETIPNITNIMKSKKYFKIKHDLTKLKEIAKLYNTKIKYLYHGTMFTNINDIVNNGFDVLKSADGFLGKGIYFGDKTKAFNYTDGIILHVAVVLGNMRIIENLNNIKLQDKYNDEYDSMYLDSKMSGFNNSEYIIRDSEYTCVVGGFVVKDLYDIDEYNFNILRHNINNLILLKY